MKIRDFHKNPGFSRKSRSFAEPGFAKIRDFRKISDSYENLDFREDLGFLRKSQIFAKISDRISHFSDLNYQTRR